MVASFEFWHVVAVSALIVIFKWHYERRRLYRLSRIIKGPVHIPLLGSLLRFPRNNEDILKMLSTLFGKFGPLFKIWTGPYLVVGCSKPEDMEIILNSPKCVDKPKMFFRPVRSVFHNGLVSAPGPLWRVNRKILNKSFGQSLLTSYVRVMSKNAQELVVHVKQESTLEKATDSDCYHTILRYTLRTIFETMLGLRSKSTLSIECTELVQDMVTWLGSRFFRYWFFIQPIFTLKGIKKETEDIFNRSLELVQKILHQKESEAAAESSSKAMLDTLIYDHKFTNKQLRDEIVTFAIGGGDTSATVISYTLLCLGLHLDVQQRVHDEVMEAVGSDEVSAEHLLQLKYTSRVIQESMRIFPVLQNIARNVSEDLPLTGGVTLPAGTTVVLSITNVHMDENYWPDPWRFDPDRFLPEISAQRPAYSYLPFSKGPRNCIAKKFGDLIVLTYVATILRHFRVETDYKTLQDVQQSSTIFNTPVNGYKIKLYERTH